MLNYSDSSLLPEEMATQSVRLREEQLKKEEEKVCSCLQFDNPFLILSKLREIELKMQRELSEKRQELLAKEESLRYFSLIHFSSLTDYRNLESRLVSTASSY